MTTVLVTGGAGFLGSHVAQACLCQGHKVVVLDDLSGGARENVPEGVEELRVHSIANELVVAALFAKYRFDYVYHLAAYAAEGLSPFIRRFNYENNVVGSAVIINACIRSQVKRLVFTSSIAVYGHESPPFHETDYPEPRDPYGIAKYAVEMDLQAARAQFGLPFTIFRPHNVYGPHQHLGDKYRNVVGIFMRQALAGEPFTVFGDGRQTRAFSYVDAVAEAIAASAVMDECAGETYNIGGDVPCTVLEVAEAVAAEFGVRCDPRFLPARHEAIDAYCDHRKVHAVFGVPPHVALHDGIKRMAEWARTVPVRSSQRPQLELTAGLPGGWS